MGRGMDIEDMVHIYNGLLLGHKKEWNNDIFSNMDRPRDYHTKWISQTETNIIWYHSYVESKKKDANELIYKTETDSQT